MEKRITFFLLLLLPLITLKAQTFDEDRAISDLWRWKQNNQWDSVLLFSNNYEVGNIESFYIQNIIGEAYYRSEDYRKAASFFQRAAELNSNDASNKLMLYNSYLYSGNGVMAKYQVSKLSKSQKKENKIARFRLIESVYLETGLCLSNNIEKNGMKEFVVETPVNITNNQFSLLDDYQYAHGGIQVSLGPSASVFASYHHFSIDEKIHQIINPGIIYKEHYFTSTENDLYAVMNIRIGKTWSIHPAWHDIRFNTQREIIQNGIPFLIDSLIPSQLAGFTLMKNTAYSSHRWGVAVSEINFNRQIHGSYEYWHYPKGNLDFYTSWKLAFISEKNRLSPSIQFTAGGKLNRFVWLEGFACIGNLKNGTEQNGYVIYNFSDNSHFHGGLNFIFPLGKHFEIRMMYQYWLKSLPYNIKHAQGQGPNNQKSTSYFDNHLLTGGFLWKL